MGALHIEPHSELCLRWAVCTSHRLWSPEDDEWRFLLSLLDPSTQREVTVFRTRIDQKRALVGRLLVRACCHQALGLSWGQVEVKRTKGKKPFIAFHERKEVAPNWNFNLAHEGDYVVLAAEPLCLCGVDVSAPDTARGQKQNLRELKEGFRDQLTAREWASVDAAARAGSDEDGLDRFRCFWSLKEAFTKARGDGLGFDFLKADFTLHASLNSGASHGTATVAIDGVPSTRWAFYLQRLGSGHWVSVARGPPSDAVDAWLEFTGTFAAPHPDGAQLKASLHAKWPPFSILQVSDLVPEHRRQAFLDILNK